MCSFIQLIGVFDFDAIVNYDTYKRVALSLLTESTGCQSCSPHLGIAQAEEWESESLPTVELDALNILLYYTVL